MNLTTLATLAAAWFALSLLGGVAWGTAFRIARGARR